MELFGRIYVKEPSMKKNIIKVIVALLVIGGGGGFIAFNMLNTAQLEAAGGVARNAPVVNWTTPHRQTIVSQVNARGQVELIDRFMIFPETQAQIQAVHVSIGDIVAVGDLLVTYDDGTLDTLNDQLAEARLALRAAELGLAATRIAPSDTELLAAENQIEQTRNNMANIQAQLNQIDLQISQIQENIRTADSTRVNIQSLFDSGVATRTELDNAEDAVQRLEDQLAITRSQRDAAALGIPMAEESERLAIAQFEAVRDRSNQPASLNQAQQQQVSIEQARLRIELIERNINDFVGEERAEVAGTVLEVFVSEGEFSATGRPLLEIADVSGSNLVVIVYVPENDAGHIDVGQEVEISGGALGTQTYAGRIDMIHPLAAPRQMGATVETVLTVEIAVSDTERLRPGLTVDADIVTQVNVDTLVVPLMATLSDGISHFVYIINQDSELERRDVVLGQFSEMYIEAEGVDEEAILVSNPGPAMYDGMQVRPLPPLD